MHATAKVALVLLMVLAGCGVTGTSEPATGPVESSTDLETLEQVREALVDGGITCDDPPKPYEAEEGAIDLGVDPAEDLICDLDGVTVTATRWENEVDRASTMVLAVGFLCGFVAGEFAYIEAGTWAIVLDTDTGLEGETDEAKALVGRVGEAVGVEPTTKQCEGEAGFGDDGNGSGTFDPVEEDPEPRTGPGGKDDPLEVGESATLDEWEVTVTEIVPDANDQVAALDDFNEPPENGQYVLVTFDATYEGESEGTPSFELQVTLSGSDSVQYTDFDCDAFVDDFDSPTVEPGGLDTVVTCLDAPSEAIDGGVIFVEPFSSFDGEYRTYWALP